MITHIGYGSWINADYYEKPASKASWSTSMIRQVMCEECNKYIDIDDILLDKNGKIKHLNKCKNHE